MKKSILKTALLGAAMVCAAFSASAYEKPSFWVPGNKGVPLWTGLSNNGKWGVASVAPTTDGTINYVSGVLYDLENRTSVNIKSSNNWLDVNDVTDDGNIVVGSVDGAPAYYVVSEKKWVKLPSLGKGWTGGKIFACTPDGKYAVGYSQPEPNEWGDFYGTMWDLEKKEVVPLGENAPYLTIDGQDNKATRITGITNDGRYLVFEISWYTGLGWSAVYDREKDIVFPLGYEDKNGSLTPIVSGLHGFSEPYLSPNGKYISGTARKIEDNGQYTLEADVAGRYSMENREMEYYTKSSDEDIIATCALSDGTIIGGSPSSYPARQAVVRYGKYFYPLSEILTQAYGINLEAETDGVGVVTGTPLFVSDDGLTWVMMATATLHDTYIMQLKEPIQEACKRVNLLNNYRIYPASGSTFSELTQVTVTFDRLIGITVSPRNIRLLDEDNNAIARASNATVVEGNSLQITFPKTALAPGMNYKIVLNEGAVVLEGDPEMKAPAIEITYHGRREGSVEMTGVNPPEGTVMAEFSLSSPITLTYDAEVAINGMEPVYLYRSGSDEPVVDVTMNATGNNVVMYPSIAQHFFKGYDYEIRIPQGVVTDLSGNGGSDAVTLKYEGSYINTGSGSDRIIWQEVFGDHGYDGLLFYEGDHLEPADVPYYWGFTKDETPWLFLRSDDEAGDWCIGSHSMYMKPGKSDDWFTSRQLYIPDANCFLRFEAQSYLKNKHDHLKVYILATDDIIQYADEAYINRMRNDGEMICDLELTPGQSEEGLDGDWTEYTFPLAQYAGKNIYIGFCNDNDDQSAIFVDNVVVEHDLSFITTFTHDEYIIDKESLMIQPIVSISSALQKYVALYAVLQDSKGNEIDSFNLTGQNLTEGDAVSIKFTKPLPLEKGCVNTFRLTVSLNAENGEIESGTKLGYIYNLLFQTQNHIVVEEYSGSDCANCPLGFKAMEKLEDTFHDAIIPVVVRTYNGDPVGQTVQTYSQFLGMNAAPSGRLNRGDISMPMASGPDDYVFSSEGLVGSDGNPVAPLWFDVATSEMKQPAILNVEGESTYNEANEVYADFVITPALDLEGMSLGVFAVLTENKVRVTQSNNLYGTTSEVLLPWSKGGLYAQPKVMTSLDGVARATYGDTFFGSLGVVPSKLTGGEKYTARISGTLPEIDGMKIENCNMVLMLINTATGRVANAYSVPMKQTGVNTAMGDNFKMEIGNGCVMISGISGAFRAEAYTLDGVKTGEIEALTNGVLKVNRGVTIVRVTTEQGTIVRKFIVD